ncbi:PLAC8-domain-containing protein [Sistotremastrum suecicum HHB10207 ss-3]|uniref:PLAC8-domain-containing protein n=1 Tax=Sistotremastrum suecicum HHB10207 ss-3 TaxID=1314776 RepID=A0A166AY75_9AGAM|nr:PLAC8-domain-containing protein [Sistotremastrum suecicum HHB10207 ss-3]
MYIDPKNPKALPFNEKGTRKWSNGLFGCFDDIGTCCTACWLPCVTYAQNRSRLNYIQANGARHPTGGEMFNADFGVFTLIHVCTGCGFLLEMMTRKRIREHYRIEGSGCGDCVASCCCLPCVMTQDSREIEAEEKNL